ncbi:MAG TPA: hypothetical protein VHL77_10120, partial [Ferruginibacter sp.]|nr:hypothetical protein [Ferruginibacter sp.]
MLNELLGIWKADASHSPTIDNFGNATMEIKPDGQLVYSIFEDGVDQRMLLTYEIDGNFLVTDQPSAPKKERTEFCIVDGKLELDYDGLKARFIKL